MRLCCEGRVRTSDLRVMSPTSYRCSTSRFLEGASYRFIQLPPNLYTLGALIMNMIRHLTMISAIVFFLLSCKHKSEMHSDTIYSRHLQKHIQLSIINTPVPKDKNTFNLLLLNDGQDIGKLRVKDIIDSLYKKELIQPLVVVAINTDARMQEYGVADYPDYQNNGAAAAKYAAFIDDELYPYIKKHTGVRKFTGIFSFVRCESH